MRAVCRFSSADCAPAREDVLSMEGMAGAGSPSAVTDGLLTQALGIFSEQAAPVGIHADIDISEFAQVFAGEGRNDAEAPLARIFPRADKLALFACTVGPELNRTIGRMFEQHDYALGYVLDAVASCGTERLADLVQRSWESAQVRRDMTELSDDSDRVPRTPLATLAYSPGYCGWHVSGQRRLFQFLKPEEVGITLRESFLMEPLKSVSGVFVLGPKEIHEFDNTFGFCSECRTTTCRSRLARLETTKE